MRTKLRYITVDSRSFRWRVTRSTPIEVCLRIWLEGNASSPWAEVLCPFSDPWLRVGDVPGNHQSEGEKFAELGTVRPRQIAEIIHKLIQHGQPNHSAPAHQIFRLGPSGELTEVTAVAR